MKRLLTIMMLGFSLFTHAQKQEDLAKFRITEAKNNGNDITQYYYERKQYFVFYLNEAKDLCLANVSGTNNDQSYGKILSLEEESKNETDETYKTDIFNFRWKYHNTYDKDNGYATISFSKIYKPTGVVFNMKMVTQRLDVVVFNGYMEGTLNLQDYIH